MQSAFDELAALALGVQLTPGNHPTPDFDAYTNRARAKSRRHHGFDFRFRKRPVWSSDARCLVDAHSVHPPASDSPAAAAIAASGGVAKWLADRAEMIAKAKATSDVKAAATTTTTGSGSSGSTTDQLLETMYPGYVLGSGDEIEDAMHLGVHLAVDVSHVFMQLSQGVMKDSTWRRLSSYEHIGEVHVSANDGSRDAHAPLTSDSFGLAWARERLRAGVPVVLECYMHRLSPAERRKQVTLVTGVDVDRTAAPHAQRP